MAMSKSLLDKLTVAQERQRLTAEYLAWARESGHRGKVSLAERDLKKHSRQVSRLQQRLALAQLAARRGLLRTLVLDFLPASIFCVTATIVTCLGRWDAGLVGLLAGLAAALTYVYFAKDTGRLRL